MSCQRHKAGECAQPVPGGSAVLDIRPFRLCAPTTRRWHAKYKAQWWPNNNAPDVSELRVHAKGMRPQEVRGIRVSQRRPG